MQNAGRRRRTPSVVAVVAALALMAGCASDRPTSGPAALTAVAPKVLAEIPAENLANGAMVVAERTRELYLAGNNPNSVAVIDTASRRFVKRIPTEEPDDLALDETTGRLYVATQNHELKRQSVHVSVHVLDVASHTVVQRFPLPSRRDLMWHPATRLAVHPPTSHLFVAALGWKPLLLVLDTKTGATVRRIPLDGVPVDVGVDSTRGRAFVSTGTGITVIDTATLRVLDEMKLPAGSDESQLAVDEDGGMVLAWEIGAGKVTVIDSASRKVLRTIRVGSEGPGDLAIDGSARRAYATRLHGFAVIDLRKLRAVKLLTHSSIEVAQFAPRTVAVDPATGAVYSNVLPGQDDQGNLDPGIVTVLAPD